MLNVGFAARDITPAPGITLSGFAARCNRPAEGVDDPLSVFALAIEEDGELGLLLVFDLLGLGPELLEEIQTALDARLPEVPRAGRALCCTHTHSAPATITLLGCGEIDRGYWTLVRAAAVEAAAEAWATRQPAVLRMTEVDVAGGNYNRRRMLADGRVVMSMTPDAPLVKVGRTWDRLLLLRFDDPAGRGIAGVAHWAAHPCTQCTQQISADFPGELRRGLAARCGLPFLFLQGACGDLNPPWDAMTRATVLRNTQALMALIGEVRWPEPAATTPFRIRQASLPLAYATPPSREMLESIRRAMGALADTGYASPETLAEMANILNAKPGEQADPMTRYMAGILRQWGERMLAREAMPEGYPLALAGWRLGPLALCFVAAEVFVDYAYFLQAAFPTLATALVGYYSPHVGYLPTDAAQSEGGYEVEQAYRFYDHPAPWAIGTEARVREAMTTLFA